MCIRDRCDIARRKICPDGISFPGILSVARRAELSDSQFTAIRSAQDVYKRQAQGHHGPGDQKGEVNMTTPTASELLVQQAREAERLRLLLLASAVSYTHLDVYKRQDFSVCFDYSDKHTGNGTRL